MKEREWGGGAAAKRVHRAKVQEVSPLIATPVFLRFQPSRFSPESLGIEFVTDPRCKDLHPSLFSSLHLQLPRVTLRFAQLRRRCFPYFLATNLVSISQVRYTPFTYTCIHIFLTSIYVYTSRNRDGIKYHFLWQFLLYMYIDFDFETQE